MKRATTLTHEERIALAEKWLEPRIVKAVRTLKPRRGVAPSVRIRVPYAVAKLYEPFDLDSPYLSSSVRKVLTSYGFRFRLTVHEGPRRSQVIVLVPLP